MKKIFKKYGTIKSIGGCLDILGLLLLIINVIFILCNKFELAQLILGIISGCLFLVGTLMVILTTKSRKLITTTRCLGVGAGCLAYIGAYLNNYENIQLPIMILASVFVFLALFIRALISEKHRTAKMIGAIALSAFIFSWLLPYGYFNGADYVNYGYNRLGIADIGVGMFYSVNFTLEKLLFIIALLGFYGVLSKIKGYQQLVTSLAKKLKKYEMVTVIVISLFLTGFTVLSKDIFAALIFAPFFASLLTKMKVDKMATFAATYGSIVMATIGTLYGTEALREYNSYLSYYLTTDVTVGLTYRGIILAVAFILYNFFIVMRVKNTKNKEVELLDDPYAVEAPSKKGHIIPAIVGLLVIATLTVLGYITWSTNWEIEVFNDFHTWISNLAIGEDFTLLKYIIGSNAVPLGDATNYGLYLSISVLFITTLVLAIIYRMKINEYFDAFYEGVKKAIKPILVIIGIYFIFVVAYMAPVVPTITNWVFGLTKGLNPLLASIMGFVASIFNIDLGYTGYSIGYYLATAYVEHYEIAHTIYLSMYGLVQVFLPSSLILMIGLTLNNIDYKSWFKYIWLFVVGMFIILVVLFAILLYI